MQAGLSSASIILAAHEIDALASAYADVRSVDATGETLVNWRGFVGDVDLVFTTPGLELDPTADVEVRWSVGVCVYVVAGLCVCVCVAVVCVCLSVWRLGCVCVWQCYFVWRLGCGCAAAGLSVCMFVCGSLAMCGL